MLSQLLRRLVGDKPVEFGHRIASAVAGPALTPVAARVLDRYRNAPPPQGAEYYADARAFSDQLLQTVDPADMVASLIISLPAVTAELQGAQNHDAQHIYQWIISHGLERLSEIPVWDWRLSDQQIAAVLNSYRRILLLHNGLSSRVFLAGIMKRAATGSPAQRSALIAFIDSTLRADQYSAFQFRIFIDENLPVLGIAPEEIPILAQWAKQGQQVLALRARLVADAGPLLGPALDRLLDGNHGLYPGKTDYSEPLQKLFDADPQARGAAFSRLLDIIVAPSGYDNLHALARFNGYFTHELGDFLGPAPPLGMLAVEMAKRKMELADPDRDHARMVFLLGQPLSHRYETNRLILNQLLKTVQAYPGGRTAQALKKLIELPSHSAWAADVREVLRDGALNAGSDPERAANLPPIELPVFTEGYYAELLGLVEHFGRLLEPRLYDRAHNDYLERVAKLGCAIDALPGGEGRDREIKRLVGAAGLQLRHNIEQFIQRGCTLHELRGAFRHLVRSEPEAVQKLTILAHQVENRSAPSAKWLRDARAVLDMLPEQKWLDQLRRISEVKSPPSGLFGMPGEVYLRTFIYLSAMLPPQDVGPLLTDYALKQCFVTLKGSGIRSEKLGNACVWALAELPDGTGVPYLARILARVKYPKVKTKIDAKLNEAAQRSGIGRDELDEISVPTHGLGRDGTRRVAFAQGEAVFRVVRNSATLDWFNESGKQLKSPSKAIKDEKELFKEVQADLKELNADLAIQPQRLQQFYLQSRAWPAEVWRARYLDHPLMRSIARGLVWWIDTPDGKSVAALPDDAGEELLDVVGNNISLDGATVRLWHPMDAAVSEVEAWRDRLEALQVTQPFAQVWREVYALTDAERATGTYTNRWAAHILKQHQVMTLARLNGWRVTHRMWVDAPNDEPWHLVIPAHNLVVDYWVKGAGGENPQTFDSVAYAYVSTDRVQFHRLPANAADSAIGRARGDAVTLAEIPPVVFSEIMRHADLFTAVASIAADPDWIDQGRDASHPTQWDRYWHETNTAALVESGKRRRAMLERIVPRLKISGKLKLDDRYLVVQGTRHEYQIHLGSGACSRGGRHICIVPKNTAQGDKIWLPFEGDRTLSIIISKAMLLAADDEITDPVILGQL